MRAAHSIVAPSSAFRWIPCPGSVMHNAATPEARSDEAAAEGQALHEAGALYLVGRGSVTKDQRYVLQSYIDHANEMLHSGSKYKCEARVEIPTVHELCFGTVDLHAWKPADFLLNVADLKCGYGIVEVVDNWQLDLYTAGLFEKYGLRWDDERIKVRQTIVQPRAHHKLGPVRTIIKTGAEILARVNQAKEAAARVLSGDPTLRTGPHCQNCAGRLTCEAFAASVSDAIQYVRSYELPRLPKPGQIAVELDLLYNASKRIEKRIAVLEEYAGEAIRRGENVPAYALEEGRSNLKWISESFVGMLEKQHGVNLTKSQPITPTQAMKLLPEATIKQYTQRPQGKTKLNRLSTTTARQIFGQK